MSTWVKQAIMDKRMMVMFDSFGIAKGKVHGFSGNCEHRMGIVYVILVTEN